MFHINTFLVPDKLFICNSVECRAQRSKKKKQQHMTWKGSSMLVLLCNLARRGNQSKCVINRRIVESILVRIYEPISVSISLFVIHLLRSSDNVMYIYVWMHSQRTNQNWHPFHIYCHTVSCLLNANNVILVERVFALAACQPLAARQNSLYYRDDLTTALGQESG